MGCTKNGFGMQWKSRHDVLTAAVQDWAARGLIDTAKAAELHADIGPMRKSFGFRGFVIIAGFLSLCFGVVTFVTANWDDMGRVFRVGLLAALLWASWGGAIYAAQRGARIWHEGLILLACGIYGAAIMLVAQMYHLQGNAADAVWLWMVGVGIAAILTRSAIGLLAAFGLLVLWHVMQFDNPYGRDGGIHWSFLIYWVIGAVVSFGIHSRLAAHGATLAFLMWSPHLIGVSDAFVLIIPLGSFVLVAALLVSLARGPWLGGFENALLGYLLLMLFGLSLLLQFDRPNAAEVSDVPVLVYAGLAIIPAIIAALSRRGGATGYDLWVCAVAAVLFLVVQYGFDHDISSAGFCLALAIWIARMGWRLDLRALRILGMVGFVIALLSIYFETLGGLLGTSMFYAGAGVIMLLGAIISAKLKPEGAA